MADPNEKKPIEQLKEEAQAGEAVTTARAQAGVATPVMPSPVRRYRALLFQGYVLAAAIGFGILFFYARTIAYFDFDITIEHLVQDFHPGWFDTLMQFVSGLGFNPLVYVLCVLIMLFVFITGLRWEAVSLLFAAGGVSLLGTLFKIIVHRQRPTSALVNVFSPLTDYSFPSGHVLLFTACVGFLWFLIYRFALPPANRNPVFWMTGTVLAVIAKFLSGASARWVDCQPDTCPRIYFANHTSHLDALVVWSSLPLPCIGLILPSSPTVAVAVRTGLARLSRAIVLLPTREGA